MKWVLILTLNFGQHSLVTPIGLYADGEACHEAAVAAVTSAMSNPDVQNATGRCQEIEP